MQTRFFSLRNLSLRLKVPLRVVGLVLVTTSLVTGALIYRAADDLRTGLLARSEGLGRMIAQTLVTHITQDDIWRSYETITTPYRATRQGALELDTEVIVVLDNRNRIFVSSDPGRFPMRAEPGRLDEDFGELMPRIRAGDRLEPFAHVNGASGRIYMVVPIVSDGVALGTLVMRYSSDIFLPHYRNLVERAAVIAALTLIVLLPLGWYWGQRTAEPLLRLSQAMNRVGTVLPDEKTLELYESRDEIGQLGVTFKHMVAELRRNQSLERHVMTTERLAALGRLSAGIAHEVNNPLGGMLNTINTYKRHGSDDPLANRTFSLLERGLKQIQETVGALLVQARVESRGFDDRDTEDIRMLLHGEIEKKQAQFRWEDWLDAQVPLPATLVRQILINLLLNALQAIPARGQVHCRTERRNGSLSLEVRNDGRHIPEDRLLYLFEPFSPRDDGEPGHGLGLWMTYQIVQQLKGHIAVSSRPGDTRFSVEIPIVESAHG